MQGPGLPWGFFGVPPGLLALVELGQPLAGLSYLRIVRILAQVSVRGGRQVNVLGVRVAQPFQKLLTILVSVRSHDPILPEALPERGQRFPGRLDWRYVPRVSPGPGRLLGPLYSGGDALGESVEVVTAF